jgi:hypothetical protein
VLHTPHTSQQLLTVLEQKRSTREDALAALAAEEAARQKEALFLGAEAAGSSARALADLQRGAERAERQRQSWAEEEARVAGTLVVWC